MRAALLYIDREARGRELDYGHNVFQFTCSVPGSLLPRDQRDHVRDAFHSTDFYMEWADQYTAEEMGDLMDSEFRFEIVAIVIGDDFNLTME